MKKTFLLVVFVLLTASVSGEDVWTWPIKGKSAGDILYRPQDYIDKVQNFGELFIGAPEGAEVVSPVSGKVSWILVNEMHSTIYCTSHHAKGDTFDEMIASVIAENELRVPSKFVHVALTISMADGTAVHIGGLRGDQSFRTGQTVKAGETIGRVGYTVPAIAEPNISISVDRHHKSADPMKPFGLRSTFQPAQEIHYPDSLSETAAREDFDILISSLKECYASYVDMVSSQKEESFRSWADSLMKGGVGFADFYEIVHSATTSRFINDSHLYVVSGSLPVYKGDFYPAMQIGALGDSSIIVARVLKGYEQYVRQEVKAVDGIPAKNFLRMARERMDSYDVNITSAPQQRLLLQWYHFFQNPLQKQSHTFTIGDNTVLAEWVPMKEVKRGFEPQMKGITYYRNHPHDYDVNILRDSVLYVSLKHFNLSEVDTEHLKDSIFKYRLLPHMIIDVRNNTGGSGDLVKQIVSWLISEPMQQPDGYCRVMSNTTYPSFSHSTSRFDTDTLFANYKPVDGKTGFYYFPSEPEVIQPDSMLNYGGRIYLLTNENSVSAATMLPSLLVRSRRGVTVGRETGTGYHYMNASSFVDIMLPNSMLQVHIPLVKIVFDDTVNERFPYMRGLMPDYEVPITYDEIFRLETDTILGYTLRLINEGQYLTADWRQSGEATNVTGVNKLLLVVMAGILLLAIIIGIRRMHKQS